MGKTMSNQKKPGVQGKFPFGKEIIHKGYKLKGWPLKNACLNKYRKILSGIKNGKIVEVGVYGGASILSVIDICIANNNVIFGIDPWERISRTNGQIPDKDFLIECQKQMKSARKNLEKIVTDLKYDKYIKLIQGFSPAKASLFDNNSLDMVYIDGEHSYNAVFSDMTAWLPKIKKNGTLWGDDFVWKSVSMAVKKFCKDNKLKFTSTGRSWFVHVV